MARQHPGLTWAVLVPAPVTVVRPLVDEAWAVRFGPDEGEVARWETRPCTGGYAQVLGREPGSEGDDEELAAILSRRLDGELFVLRFRDDAPAVWVFEHGAFTREEPPIPWAVADRLGCVPGPDEESPGPSDQASGEPPSDVGTIRTPSVCVVEGASADDVRSALRRVVSDAPLRVVPNALGALVHAEGGGAALLAGDIAEELPGSTVYAVMVGPAPDRFGVLVHRHDADTGSFEAGAPGLEGFTALQDVRGQHAPSEILRVLGVPPALLQR
jgi:hypothetical protein